MIIRITPYDSGKPLEPVTCTWDEFVAQNSDGIDATEFATIAATLQRGEIYRLAGFVGGFCDIERAPLKPRGFVTYKNGAQTTVRSQIKMLHHDGTVTVEACHFLDDSGEISGCYLGYKYRMNAADLSPCYDDDAIDKATAKLKADKRRRVMKIDGGSAEVVTAGGDHPHVGVGYCSRCGHYGADCTGIKQPLTAG